MALVDVDLVGQPSRYASEHGVVSVASGERPEMERPEARRRVLVAARVEVAVSDHDLELGGVAHDTLEPAVLLLQGVGHRGRLFSVNLGCEEISV